MIFSYRELLAVKSSGRWCGIHSGDGGGSNPPGQAVTLEMRLHRSEIRWHHVRDLLPSLTYPFRGSRTEVLFFLKER
jgi:hypothetical protein